MYLIFFFITSEYIKFQKCIMFTYVALMLISCFIGLSCAIQDL